MAATEDSHEEVEHLFLRRDSATSNARWCMLGGVLALVSAGIGFAVAIFTRVDQLSFHAITTLPTLLGLGALTAARSLASTPQQVAVPGEARIERRFLAPNGVTPRLEYRITTADGLTATRNAEVTRDDWDRLEEASNVPVVYVADEPAISRLTEGEPESKDLMDRPAVMYGLSIAGGLLCLLLLVAAALQWRGWDIDLDSKTGKVSIKRFGTES